jgi:glycosyltransferase involved in cell wall biosynthesis
VSLFAAPDSDPSLDCAALQVRYLELSAAASTDPSMPGTAFMADHHAYLTLMLRLARHGTDKFDVIHNHSLHHLPVAMAPTLATPMLCTLHTPPTPWLESAISATAGAGARFAAVSSYTARSWQHLLPDVAVVRNGVDGGRWPLGLGGSDLVWFGRITPEKGPHLAIDAARRAGRPLVIAGPVSDPDYFARDVEPRLGGEVRYAGHLAHRELAHLVGASAAALVTPQWDEPYGLGSRRGHDVRHARRGLRPWRHSRDRRPRRGAASADRRRRRHGRGDPGRAHAVPACRAHAGRTTLFGSRHGRRLPRHLPRHDRRHRTDRL